MDALQVLLTRRSIRQYTGQPVEDEVIRKLLEAAMCAPSAGDARPWHFVVIRERALLDAVPALHPHAAMAASAPLAIMVCADPRVERVEGYWPQDCAAATQSLLLAAHAFGLGAVWTGIYPVEERITAFRRLCGLPEPIVPFAFIPLGYPAEQPEDVNRFDTARVHYDRW